MDLCIMYVSWLIDWASEIRVVGADGIAIRNTLASRTVCMRVCRISLVIKAGESLYTVPFIF